MKIIKTIFKIILLLIIVISITNSNIYAFSAKEVFEDADSFASGDATGVVGLPEESNIRTLSNVVSGVLIAVGVIVALVMIAVMGINFMIQSAEKKAEIKESLMPFLIGALVTFGAFGIWRIAISLLNGI